MEVLSEMQPIFLVYKDLSHIKEKRKHTHTHTTEVKQTRLRACSVRESEKKGNTNGL